MLNADAADSQALFAVADTLAYPLMVLRVDAHLLYANSAATAMLHAGLPLGLNSRGVVHPASAPRRSTFLHSLREAAAGQRQALLWLDGAAGLQAWVCPLGTSHDGEPPQPVMLVQSPPAGLLLDVSGFAVQHKLSPAETRVLQQLVAGRNTRDTAQALGVGVATVRTHVMGIRRKTGHHGVPALLTALGSLPPLLPGL